MQLRIVGAILLAAAGSACSANSELLGQMYVSPGKYEYYRCPDLNVSIALDTAREKELTGLVDRASQDKPGTVVSAMVYNPQLAAIREELRQLHTEWTQKDCHLPPAPAPPAASADAPKPRQRSMR